MGRWTPRYTDSQKRAIVAACLDWNPGLSVAEACRRAADGTIGVPAFTMPTSTAHSVVKDEKRRRRGEDLSPLAKGDVEQAFDQLLRRNISLIDYDLQEFEKKLGQRNYDRNEHGKLLSNIRTLRAISEGKSTRNQRRDSTRPERSAPQAEGQELSSQLLKDWRRNRMVDTEPELDHGCSEA